jgi:phage-related protein
MVKPTKRIAWLGSSKADLKALPKAVLAQAGYELFLVQCGLEPTDWKPMSTVGAGVREIRVRDSSGAFRVIYLMTRPEAIYVLHCFQKKTQTTSRGDIELAQKRLELVAR